MPDSSHIPDAGNSPRPTAGHSSLAKCWLQQRAFLDTADWDVAAGVGRALGPCYEAALPTGGLAAIIHCPQDRSRWLRTPGICFVFNA